MKDPIILKTKIFGNRCALFAAKKAPRAPNSSPLSLPFALQRVHTQKKEERKEKRRKLLEKTTASNTGLARAR